MPQKASCNQNNACCRTHKPGTLSQGTKDGIQILGWKHVSGNRGQCTRAVGTCGTGACKMSVSKSGGKDLILDHSLCPRLDVALTQLSEWAQILYTPKGTEQNDRSSHQTFIKATQNRRKSNSSRPNKTRKRKQQQQPYNRAFEHNTGCRRSSDSEHTPATDHWPEKQGTAATFLTQETKPRRDREGKWTRTLIRDLNAQLSEKKWSNPNTGFWTWNIKKTLHYSS